MARTALTDPRPSVLQTGVLLFVTATSAAAQTEFPHAAGTDSTGRAQAASDASGRVLIESPEFPRGLWVDLADEAGQALGGIQVEFQGRPDSLAAFRCVDPSGLFQETMVWAHLVGDPLRLPLSIREPADLPAGLATIDWRVEPGAEGMLAQEEGQEFTDWEAVTAFLQERWRGRTGRVAVWIDSNTALALDLVHAEPAARLVDHLQDQYRRSLGAVSALPVRVLLSPYAPGESPAFLEDTITLTSTFILVPGSDLEEWVLTTLRRSRGPVTWSEASALTGLDLTWHQIVDVSPLVLLTSLEWLRLSENRIVDVSPLASLTRLRWLRLGNNEIAELSPLASLTRLEWLVLRENRIVDVSPLASLTRLEWLELWANEIVDVSPLASLTNLKWLWVSANRIIDVSPLASLTNLTWLGAGWNQIIDVSPLASLTRLDLLRLDGNEIVDVSPLASLTLLEELRLGGNRIVDVSPLASLTRLDLLRLGGNEIVDVSPLASLTRLEHLELGGNEIVDVSPLTSLPTLRWLSLRGNEIQDIGPLVANPGLGEGDTIRLEGNSLSDRAINEQIPALEARGVTVTY